MLGTCRSGSAGICKPQSPPWQWSLILGYDIKKELNLVLPHSWAGLCNWNPGNRDLLHVPHLICSSLGSLVSSAFSTSSPNQTQRLISVNSSPSCFGLLFYLFESSPIPTALWKRMGRNGSHLFNFCCLNFLGLDVQVHTLQMTSPLKTSNKTQSRTTVLASHNHSKPSLSHWTPHHHDWIPTPEKMINFAQIPVGTGSLIFCCLHIPSVLTYYLLLSSFTFSQHSAGHATIKANM